MSDIFNTLKLPDFVTLINALCGFGAIVTAQNEMLQLSCILILIAAIADGLDGTLARYTGGSEIGGALDSLADVISFGVAPAKIITAYTGNKYFVLIAVCFYLVCGILRLARFSTSKYDNNFFKGLPITAGGITVAVILLVSNGQLQTLIMEIASLILGVLMVSSIPYMKIRGKEKTLPLTVIFAIPILSYFLQTAYTSALASPLLLIMMLYIISPLFIKSKEKIHESKKQHN